MRRSQAGFTLLEVVVAIAVIGAGFAVGLAAMSGSLRVMRTADEYQQAMLLGRAAMTEALAYPDYDIVEDRERELYQGVEYAYRVEFRPVHLTTTDTVGPTGSTSITDPGGATSPPPSPLEQISVDVYWGEGRSRTYRLVTYRLRQSASETTERHARGNAPAGENASAGSATQGTDAPRADGRHIESRSDEGGSLR